MIRQVVVLRLEGRGGDPNAIQTLGSGIGAGNVNAMMEKKYSYDVGDDGGEIFIGGS